MFITVNGQRQTSKLVSRRERTGILQYKQDVIIAYGCLVAGAERGGNFGVRYLHWQVRR